MPNSAPQRVAPQPSPDLGPLPPAIIARLASEGITTLEDWRRLTRRQKRALFGVVTSMVSRIDALARGAP